MQQAREYLSRVLPWPQDGEPPAFVNVHYTFEPDDHKPGDRYPWAGRACRSVDEALSNVQWALSKSSTRDIFVCMSTQRQAIEQTARNGSKYFKPIRNQANAVALKSLFIDIDFKGGSHGYDTQEDAVKELARFLQETKLPKPTKMVLSGGGVHVYWVLDRALPLVEWQPLAYALAEATRRHGLKCDTQCTVDGARVLRIPDTFNRKLNTPRPVRFAGRGNGDFPVEQIAQALEPYRHAVPSIAARVAGLDPSIFPLRPPLPDNELSEGLDERAPIKLADVARECAFVRDALATGGKSYIQPMWNLSTLIATFTEGGRADAHAMGKDHPGYTKESTDALFDRKEKEKAQKALGWPSCSAIYAAGCAACKACPHFNKGKSPLHFATPVVTQQVTPSQPATDELPKGYSRDTLGRINRIVNNPDGTTDLELICEYSLERPWLQRDPPMLHFKSRIERGVVKSINVPLETVGVLGMRSYLQSQGFMLPAGPKGVENVTRFLLSWIKMLHETRDSVSSSPFGWNYKGANLEGFVFGDQVWTPNGSSPAAAPDPVIHRQYAPSGDCDPWVAAAKMITDQKRPALETIVASAFAAPLVQFTGELGTLVSAYSKESGVGKSTAMKVAQAVWGDPVTAMQSLNDTENSVMNKVGQIRSLPLYWDELKTDDQTRKFISITFQVTLGREKSRLGRAINQREPGRWKTLLVSASNDSLLDHVLKFTSTTTAGLYRVFEFTVPAAVAGAPGQLVPSDAALLVSSLDNHHGMIGLEYAKFLGAHHAQVADDMQKLLTVLHKQSKSRPDERFWLAAVATILMGASYANRLGFTSFHVDSLKKFLLSVLADMRKQLDETPADYSKDLSVSSTLNAFLQEMRSQHTIVTNQVHKTKGKPPKGSINVLVDRCDPSKINGVYVHVGWDDKILRISHYRLSEWLAKRNVSRHIVIDALKSQFKARPVTGRLGSGLDSRNLTGGTEYLLEMSLLDNPAINFIDEA